MKNFFQQINWLVFFAYLLFGLGGGIAVACCAGDEAEVCASAHSDALSGACLTSAANHPAPCAPCYDHNQAPNVERTHLVSCQPVFRISTALPASTSAVRAHAPCSAELTRFSLRRSVLLQNPALLVLRSTILLI